MVSLIMTLVQYLINQYIAIILGTRRISGNPCLDDTGVIGQYYHMHLMIGTKLSPQKELLRNFTFLRKNFTYFCKYCLFNHLSLGIV